MDNKNIISFEEYRKRKLGSSYKEDTLSDLFKKDLREQDDLIEWYQFHKRLNKHKLFAHCLFSSNHQEGNRNPNSGFLVANNKEQLEEHTSLIVEAVKWENRQLVLIEAENKTYRQMGQELCGLPLKANYDAHKEFEALLLTTDKVLIIQELSKSKIKSSKDSYARSLIKTLDDAHFKDVYPKSDLIFIDYGDFLFKSWQSIGPYLEILA
uniref:Uncharacterized protein n=1 Tax=Candidatus Kentrum sp. UNK TaxID=2126344 RepID=A0A451B1H7_9GAMM|nr:MAG: hypothetical protein BECKUNK1418G_GA0071005_110113 [Candidatus Kentron sp. UNK]VFK72131.1 MAG: hypothetical protein BECKUNK1418H_GA0071006_109714 [Candidatus Kentron sp. UNK]